ncbi:hypothetical protein IWW45_007110 [Coemansia sp. RSA 485]|nr:hypothetical protein IWW45_007110 [Coemansia sp. RSA 485]
MNRILAYICISLLVVTQVTGNRATEYSKGDDIEVYFRHQPTSGEPQWMTFDCLETQRPLEIPYGKDTLIQCSIKSGSQIHMEMKTGQVRARIKKDKNSGFVNMVALIEKANSGGFNFVLHGSKGRVVAAGLYPVIEHSLPAGVEGVVTLQFNVKWYAGGGLAVLMANQRYEEEFIIQPVVALMFCILTACLVYVVGRVYVEGWVIPNVLKKSTMIDDKLGESKKSI